MFILAVQVDFQNPSPLALIAMKFFLQFVFIFGATRILAQDVVQAKSDSLVIRDETLVADLFSFGTDPMKYLSSSTQPGPQTQTQPVRSKHDDNAIDTAYRFAFGSDIFIVLKTSHGDASVIHADVETTKFKTKQGIVIGMPVADVIKALETYKIKSIARYLVLRGDAAKHYVIMYFKSGKVVFMEYFTPP
ncbi:MAG TPA: hypothetical protein VIU12_31965 [Chryseolinea sp.]